MCSENEPLVSVLMTSFNREKFIAQSIESVLASTYANLELIIVDDCSLDATVEIAKQYVQKDERVKVYVNKTNLGDYPNRNHAATYVSGKYMKYVDSDDLIYPHTLATMVEMMEAFPEAGWGVSMTNDAKHFEYPIYLKAGDIYRYHYFTSPVFFGAPSSVIFKTDAFKAVGGFLPKRMIGDFEMWHRIALKHDVVLMPPELVWLRTHEGQELSSFRKYAIEYEKIKLKYINDPSSALTKAEVKLIIKRRRRNVFKIGIRKLLSLDISEASLRMKVWFFYINK